jgi:hypothetical protein
MFATTHMDEPQKEEVEVNQAVASLQKLSALESETLAAEINLLGMLRDRLSPAAHYSDKIQTRYRKLRYGGEAGSEQTVFLQDGFPFIESGKPLVALLVIDRYGNVELESARPGEAASGQYVGERLYLTHDRKWILAERVGAYREATGGTNEWEANCRIVTDRSLLERYSLDAITEGLFAATNKLWEKLSPRMAALKKRSEKAHQVIATLARSKPASAQRYGARTISAGQGEQGEKAGESVVRFSRPLHTR